MTTKTDASPPFALFIRGDKTRLFDIADQLGFENDMSALAVSLFEDGPDSLHIQALYTTEAEADQASTPYLDRPDLETFVTQLEDEDWVSKSQQGLPPVIAGPFCVHGDHDKDKIPSSCPYPVHIDAGLAFGTGHHGTTKGCLIALDQILNTKTDIDRVLDLGCGAGTLAIAYTKATSKPAIATDIDPDAVYVTRENAKINEVASLITADVSDGFEHEILRGQTFDLIFANILAEPLMGLAPDIFRALAPGGQVILSGILDEKADKVAKAFMDAGVHTSPQPSLSGWTSLIGHRPA